MKTQPQRRVPYEETVNCNDLGQHKEGYLTTVHTIYNFSHEQVRSSPDRHREKQSGGKKKSTAMIGLRGQT